MMGLTKRYNSLSMANRVSVACTIITLISAIIIIILFAIFKGQTGHVKESVRLDCGQLGLQNKSVIPSNFVRLQIGDIDYCCAKDKKQMSAMLQLALLKEQERQEPSLAGTDPANFSLAQDGISAHKVTGYCKFYMGPKGDNLPNFNPGPEGDLVFISKKYEKFRGLEHVSGVEALTDGFRIIRPGVYYVYSSLHFAPIGFKKCGEFPTSTFYHTVYRMRPGTPEERITLLEATHTCSDEKDVDSHTTYTGGQFELEAGDIIKVRSSIYGVLLLTGDSNFLGLFMI